MMERKLDSTDSVESPNVFKRWMTRENTKTRYRSGISPISEFREFRIRKGMSLCESDSSENSMHSDSCRFTQDFEVKEVIHRDQRKKVVSVVNKFDRIPYAVKVSRVTDQILDTEEPAQDANIDDALQEVFALSALS